MNVWIVAANIRAARQYATEHGLRSKDWSYAGEPRYMHGMSGAVVFVDGWKLNKRARQIADIIREAVASKHLKIEQGSIE